MTPPQLSASRPLRKGHLRMVPAHASAQQGQAAGPAPAGVASLEEAYRRYAPYVAAVAVRILGRSDELDDLVQDVFVEATRGIASLTEPQAIKSWLARITVRASVRKLRRRRLLRALYLVLDEPIDYDALAAPDASPEQRATVARIYRMLDALPAAERVAWVLRHVQGETLEQAAALCACSQSTYQRRLRRASLQLDLELPDE